MLVNQAFAILTLAPLGSAGSLISFDALRNGENVADYYDAGFGSLGSGPGPALGLTFQGATVEIRTDAGGTGQFRGEPSPVSALFSTGFAIVNSRTTISDLSLFYSNPFGTTEIRAYSGTDLTGQILSITLLAPTSSSDQIIFSSFSQISLRFDAAARSIGIVSRASGGLYLDDMDLTTASAVPEPSSVFLIAGGLWVLMLRLRSCEYDHLSTREC